MVNLASLMRRLRSSMWLIPSGMTLAACALAALTLWFDHQRIGTPDFLSALPLRVGVEGARGLLSTVAGSIITVTGVVFSITIVVLQLASGQFTPRILRNFTEDRATQAVLGVFIGTFTYALIVLRSIRSAADDYDRFVPVLSVTLGLLFCLVSIGFLIFFINHIARSIQAEVIIARVTEDAARVVDQLFPETADGDPPIASPSSANAADTADPADAGVAVCARKAGYFQAVDRKRLAAVAASLDALIIVDVEIGAFILPGMHVVSVHGQTTVASDKGADEILSCILTGVERSNDQDVGRGLMELTDIAVRALSPGVNDPTTAIACVDRLTQIIALLGERQINDIVEMKDGVRRVVVRQPSFEDVAMPPLRQLRHHGSGDPAVALRLIESNMRLASLVLPERRHLFSSEARQVLQAASILIKNETDLEILAGAVRPRR